MEFNNNTRCVDIESDFLDSFLHVKLKYCNNDHSLVSLVDSQDSVYSQVRIEAQYPMKNSVFISLISLGNHTCSGAANFALLTIR